MTRGNRNKLRSVAGLAEAGGDQPGLPLRGIAANDGRRSACAGQRHPARCGQCTARTRAALVCGCVALCLLLFSSCGPSRDARDSTAKPLVRDYKAGAVTLVQKLDRTVMTVADRLNVSVTVSAPESMVVEFPRATNAFDRFTVVDAGTDPAELAGPGIVKTRHTWILEPFLAGDYRVPPIAIRAGKEEINTESIPVKVNSLLNPSAAPRLGEIAGPVSMPRSPVAIAVVTAVILAVVVAIIFLLRRRMSREEKAQIKVAPHDAAFMALDALQAENLVAGGMFKLFYQRVSDILRRYIEDRFALRAPEQTTEEFLETIRSSAGPLDTKYRPLLAGFLKQCDLVKFAEHRPTEEDSGRAVDTCRSFIAATIPVETSQPGEEKTANAV